MKTTLFATAAVLAALVSAPAFAAETIGSVGAAYNYTNVDTNLGEQDGSSAIVDGSVAIKTTTPWTVTLNGALTYSDNALSDDTNVYGTAHATYLLNNGVRVGAFAGLADVADDTVWAVGGEAHKYFDTVTLSGVVAYGQTDDTDADLWAVRGDARYFVNDNVRLNANLGFANVDAGAIDADVWNIGLGGEYKFADNGWSVFGGYNHAESEDLADLKADSVNVGVRYTFGGSLKDRDRAGADLTDIGGLFGGFLR
ncbi:outer membrane beta-barrel protein [Caulobacter sp. NIBR2454]|uniref:outer membrane beta-barrel protein n=1 Tax=Caulobacter sp. NIBR2454 TaxID=3015996 RepID=UPI0022B626E8|nr:outer membrane beta-barrel protein [Caulobacter sp. NIBR2454]